MYEVPGSKFFDTKWDRHIDHTFLQGAGGPFPYKVTFGTWDTEANHC